MVREEVLLDHGPGRDDAHDVSLHQSPGFARIFQLIADGDAIATVHQPRQIPFNGVVRDAAHRYAPALTDLPGSERDLELAGGYRGIVPKELIEVAEPEHQQRAREAGPEILILAHHRREIHRSMRVRRFVRAILAVKSRASRYGMEGAVDEDAPARGRIVERILLYPWAGHRW